MAVSQEIIENVKQVRNATYGKEVREAIARGLELCYGYTSGETAIEAAERANAAAAAVEDVTVAAQATLEELQRAVANVDDIVKVSETQPTEAENKIWIQPQPDTEYKIASFAAYEALWNRMTEVNETYQQGHGGVVSIVKDEEYSDPQDALKRKFVVTYSDGTTTDLFMNDGPTGPTGPLDQITGTTIYYHKGVIEGGSFVPTPPTNGWSSDIPSMSPGDYLWTQTIISYNSGAEAYLYGLTRWGSNGRDGVDGTGAVNSVQLGSEGSRLVGDIVLPVDSAPTEDSGSLILSGGIYSAIQNLAPKASPALTGTPTAPTAPNGDASTRIATTQFVQNSLSNSSFKRIPVLMNGDSFTYLHSIITENTYCLFAGVPATAFRRAINWKTETGKLTLTAERVGTQPVSFSVILVNTVEVTN